MRRADSSQFWNFLFQKRFLYVFNNINYNFYNNIQKIFESWIMKELLFYLRLKKIPLFIMASLIRVDICMKYSNASLPLSIALKILLVGAKIMLRESIYIFVLSTDSRCATFFLIAKISFYSGPVSRQKCVSLVAAIGSDLFYNDLRSCWRSWGN